MKAIGKLGDLMLGKLIPQSKAAAICPPDCVQERQSSGGKCRYRQCCDRPNCTHYCSAWSAWGACTS